MARAEATVEDLIGMIERGELRLPEMQRRYVWRATRVRDLFDSLYRGYPSGAILVWDTDEDVPEQDFAISQARNPYASTRLLLDGQQRLTSLAAVIRGEPLAVRGRKHPIELLFNLEHPEDEHAVTEVDDDPGPTQGDADEVDLDDDDLLAETEADASSDELVHRFGQMTFVVKLNKLAKHPAWVEVSDIFNLSDAELLRKAGVTRLDDPRYEKYSNRLKQLRAIRDYTYRMDIVGRARSYGEVTQIFVRVNSLGAKLRSSDLALAQITAAWPGSLQVFDRHQERCVGAGFPLDLGLLVKNLVAFATSQSRFGSVGRLSRQRLEDAWKPSCEGMEFAMNFLRSNAGIDSVTLLSSPFLLVAIGYLGHRRNFRLSSDEERLLRYWALVANAKGRYSRGSTETYLDQDLATIRDGGGPRELIERLRLQVGRLEVVPEELEGRNQRSALFKTMFLAFRAAGAKDWFSGVAIALDHAGAIHRLQFHHVFPKAILKSSYSSREADDIANLAFIAGRTNRWIGAKAPAVYFSDILAKRGPDAFTAQAVPTQSHLLTLESFRGFCATRRELTARMLNEFLGAPS